MSESAQLDRSLLEGKKADELRAIAKAAGVTVPARATKSGVIDELLKSSGRSGGSVSDTSTEERPKRARTRKSADAIASPESTPASVGGGDVSTSEAAPKQAESNRDGSSEIANNEAREPRESREPRDNRDVSQGREPREGNQGREPREPREPRNRDKNRDRDRGDRPGGQGQGQGGGQGGQGFDNYGDGPGNSRSSRRRRGRNRNRDERFVPQNTEAIDAAYEGETVAVSGVLDLNDQGFGFLRTKNMSVTPADVYVPVSQVRKYLLRKGDTVDGQSRPAASNEKFPALLSVDKINDLDPDVARQRPRFEDLTPLFPDSKLQLEVPGDTANLTARIVDLLSPIGKGQRGLIVSPPKAGKTTVMKQIAHSIEANNPDVHLMVLLIDERPEEVTDMRRTVRGEVVASTFDRPADEHTRVTEIALERAKRLVEMGQDVVIILDGITRLARAYNLAAPASGRIMSGGVDSGALYPPKRFFGSARNVEEGGSLTILATALVDTGSKMDEVIFEEFKGTGNMELKLDRRLAERRLYPAIDVNGSSTRHEELLFERTQLNQVWKLRRVLNALAEGGNTASGLELLMDKIKSTASNDEFLADIAKTPIPGS